MNKRRFITEIGMGIDQHGQDTTNAAKKAVQDAIARNYLIGLSEIAGLDDPNEMIVDVLIAVPFPELVNKAVVLSALPYGQKSIEVVKGGLVTEGGRVLRDLGDANSDIVVAIAAITVSVPDK